MVVRIGFRDHLADMLESAARSGHPISAAELERDFGSAFSLPYHSRNKSGEEELKWKP